ncbi:M23 family metallopeptidase [Mycetocola zhujimingii]|uniref:M23ase beta-sheet core domain-containing protein n=1 Tax=Mycetocola zhujimingii TaxID=2079792 RepID=A0A2U1TI49_9MICO|nr:M23 family metallopeptidase [Mycetocola zhujimingii]PWC08565.1 hypothetical protein DF223_04385 [Mycetocola zhujimingii]
MVEDLPRSRAIPGARPRGRETDDLPGRRGVDDASAARMSRRAGRVMSADQDQGARASLPEAERHRSIFRSHSRRAAHALPRASEQQPRRLQNRGDARHARPARTHGGGLRTAFAVMLALPGLFLTAALPYQGASPAAAGGTDGLNDTGLQSFTVSAGTRPNIERDLYSATSMEELTAARAAAAAVLAAAEAEAEAAEAEAAALAALEARDEYNSDADSPGAKSRPSDSDTYFDLDDSELTEFLLGRSGTWVRPVEAPVSSPYGPRHIICNAAGCSNSFHDGVDFGAGCGTPVEAVSAGRVVFVGDAGAYGNRVIVDHGGGIESIYGHLSGGSFAVEVGDLIEAGTVVAEVGVTGVVSGCHLDLKIRVEGEYGSPVAYLAARGVTV